MISAHYDFASMSTSSPYQIQKVPPAVTNSPANFLISFHEAEFVQFPTYTDLYQDDQIVRILFQTPHLSVVCE